MNQVPGFNVSYAKSAVRHRIDSFLEYEECEKRFHASCSNLGDNELLRIESGDGVDIVQTVKLTVVFAVVLS